MILRTTPPKIFQNPQSFKIQKLFTEIPDMWRKKLLAKFLAINKLVRRLSWVKFVSAWLVCVTFPRY